MDELSVTQAELARRMGCSQQYVSNLLKGSSNMTLETIGRLEKALNLDILRSAISYVSGYNTATGSQKTEYLNEPLSPEDTDNSGTATFVDGYAKGKKQKRK
jgi:transcriptional regulator with XRE-family HTH domain